ncbi:ABC transporter substrate-binding protein [Rhodoferax saidenbachensis]|uniref:ABC-type branched-subunit amino acid transport system substrate-binding protein n=1 Tax=Rhodoferax saidenbachensis TaxID=1484693 RepID=A0ABU1ZPK1_9BURK|nr:ABC transporter substrate-binding protein [Rhodoferax saidenbachensis]MDR7307476.1 ABC-type branched-subunit amino acid transport system substrate-binding protein [Rhodoferax saidenbachensis]
MNRLQHLVMASLLATACSAQAQIRIGQTVGVTGAVAATVKESNFGAQLYLDAINAKGGVGGEKIELITLDDKFDPKLTAANARELIEQRQVLALFMTRGTPHTEGIIPILDEHGVPLLAPSTGAMVLHTPLKKHVFNVRATYQREAERAIAHLAAVGVTRIAVVHVDDSFGADGLEGAQKGLAAAKLTSAAVAKFDRSKPDFTQIAPAMAKLAPQAIMVIGSGTAVVDGIRALKDAGSGAQFVTLSNNASSGFVKLLGDNARGVIVSQVLPQSLNYALVQEAAQLAKAHDILEVSPAMLEGFASAKVLVEALRRAGPKPTREKLQAALESLSKFDLGGLTLSFSPTDHTGLDFADLSIISASGKFRR